MAKTLLVTSGKGGTGKSTVTALLGRTLANLGKNVLLLEMDCGLRGLDLMLGVADRVVYDLADLILGRCKPVKGITVVPSERGNLHLIAAPVDRWFVPDVDSLMRLIERLSFCYEYMIIDGPAGLGQMFEAARDVCDAALLVTNADPVTLRDGAKTAALLAPKPGLLVVNRFLRRQLTEEVGNIDRMIDLTGCQLVSVIPCDPLVAKATSLGLSPPEGSPGWGEFQDFARRLTGEQIRLDTGRLK